MKSKLDKALSLVALGVIGVLQSAQAAPVYEVVNIEDYDLKGTLDGTRIGYALGVNGNDELVGVAKGKKKLTTSDAESDIIDLEDGITETETITYSITTAIVANNYAFVAAQNGAAGAWVPTFESISGTTNPVDTSATNSVDTFYYGINDAGIKVGSMTAPQKTADNTATENDAEDLWYYRDFEFRGVAMDGNVEIPLPPPYTQYVSEDDKTVELGGWSSASAVNNSNLVVGYASTGISSYGATRVDYCLSDDNTLPLDVCVQREQYPTSTGSRNIQYQTRAYVWQIENAEAIGTELPLGLTPASDSTLTFTAQALGVSDTGVVAGRSHVYRNGNTNRLRQDAAYWMKDTDGNYQYHWIPMGDSIYSSVAYDVNDDGIVVGSYSSYIQGYLRDKFFYFDINNPDAGYVTPNDFATSLTDLSSKPKDINNKGQVVGYIDTTYDKEKRRPKAGFLYEKSSGEFSNLNDLLTCGSKGFEQDSEGNWARHKVELQDGSGKTLSYEASIQIAEAASINEDGTIVGTALVRKPSYQLDDNGNIVLGDNGLPLFELSGSGDPVTNYVPRMVVLKPASNGSTACTVNDSSETGNYERKGAASFAWLFALPLLWLRRRAR
ncbi:DUF3466 family protein [Shewanella acanthi]|uniref:DUF3466 family protein n=1 Tax=Shewanella acanthi TaxID=2864212 RepID=UPI001C65E7B9|nr:DUF3466 family protein [Shewanella acanthi]QYJ80107.1 DUF3466 family protein [Shewanella acanthi]